MIDKKAQLERARLLDMQARARGERKPVLPVPKIEPKYQPVPPAPPHPPLAKDQLGRPIRVGDNVAYLAYVNGTPRVMVGHVLSSEPGRVQLNTRRLALTKFHNVVRL